jgi:hypothetical protein
MNKNYRGAFLLLIIIFAFQSCAVKKGCPSEAANIGAERILSGDPKAVKAINHGKKFDLNKF